MCIIGYAIPSKVHRFYDINAKMIIQSNNDDLYENKFPFKSRNSLDIKSNQTNVIRSTEINNKGEINLQRSKRVRVAKDYGPDYAVYVVEENQMNVQEALSSLDVDLWQEAINDEIDYLESNGT